MNARKAAKTAAGAVRATDALDALQNVTEAVREYLVLKQHQETKRAEIDAYKVLETERIRAAERVLTTYFDKVFQERAGQFDEMWQRLDEAAESGDGDRVTELLGGIVTLAKQSPLAELTDLSQVRVALEDPNHKWEL